MKHTVADLKAIIRAYFPRAASAPVNVETTEEHRRLVTARKKAGENKAMWSAVLRDIEARLPGCMVQTDSLHLPTGWYDSGYAAIINLPDRSERERRHELRVVVSFLAPYYALSASIEIYPEAWRDPPRSMPNDLQPSARQEEQDRSAALEPFNAAHAAEELNPQGPVVLYVPGPSEPPLVLPTREQRFNLAPDEEPYARAAIEVIEASFPGYELMPTEVGMIPLPDVFNDAKPLGEATIYDCLFTSSW